MNRRARRAAAKGQKPTAGWTPFAESVPDRDMPDWAFNPETDRLYVNSRYTVILCLDGPGSTIDDAVHLSIRRNDRKPARDWRDFQRIKNELCGPEREGIELYPAESRLVDTANQYHLWVMPTGSIIPLGFRERAVADDSESKAAPGAVQRPIDEPPDDIMSGADLDRAIEERGDA